MEPIVRARGLTKVYPGGVLAVDGIDLEAGPGVTVLMGPNGSGKTTTLMMIAGALRPTMGEVLVCGLPMWRGDRRRPRECVGLAPQDMPFREKLSVKDNLVWYGLLRGFSPGEAGRRARSLLSITGLEGLERRSVASLSGGQRRRLALAAALMGEPRVLVLDEPTSGLDPAARERLWRLIRGLARERVVLVSTHIPEEAESYADRVYIFHRGRVAASGHPRELINRYAPEAVIVVEGVIPRAPSIEGARLAETGPRFARFLTHDPDRALPRIVAELARGGARLLSVRVARPGLREVYYKVTGERLEQG